MPELSPKPRTLASLAIADPPDRWKALGFTVEDDHCDLGGVRLNLNAGGQGITQWAIHNIRPTDNIDGLSTTAAATPSQRQFDPHPNGAIGIDHVVILTPDFDRTAQALEDAGLALRRIRQAGTFRQGFRRLGPAILELVEAKDAPEGPAHFWGLVVIVSDLDALSDRLADRLGAIKPAVQPSRRIATLRASAGLSEAVAFMDPER
jgi:hypothetical protein